VVHPAKLFIPEHGTPHFWKLWLQNGCDTVAAVATTLPSLSFWNSGFGSKLVTLCSRSLRKYKHILQSKFSKLGCTMLGDEYFSRVYHNEFLTWYARRARNVAPKKWYPNTRVGKAPSYSSVLQAVHVTIVWNKMLFCQCTFRVKNWRLFSSRSQTNLLKGPNRDLDHTWTKETIVFGFRTLVTLHLLQSSHCTRGLQYPK